MPFVCAERDPPQPPNKLLTIGLLVEGLAGTRLCLNTYPTANTRGLQILCEFSAYDAHFTDEETYRT